MKDAFRIVLRYSGFIFFIWISFFCAGQYPPPGGPLDKTPLEVISTLPVPGTLKFHGDKLRIEFSKYISPLKVQEAIFFSPSLGQLTYDWGWQDVEIRFSDTLRSNTTYILTLGTDAQDNHGNSLSQAFALPFSTGEKIDSASISGKVFDQNPSGIMIYAYKLDGISSDTLNPTHTKPDFLTQTGKEGTFTLTNLAVNTYRLIAVRDQYKNLLYDAQVDDYGLLPGDISLPSSRSSVMNVKFKLTTADTVRPFLSSAKAIDRSEVLMRFSKPIDARSIDLQKLSVIDTLSKSPLEVYDVSLSESNLEANLVTAAQESTQVYRVKISGVRDLHGNQISDTGKSANFNGTNQRDTLMPAVRFLTGADSLRNIDPDDTLWLTFAKPVLRMRAGHAIHLRDSTNKDVDVDLKWMNSNRAILKPARLDYGAWYRLTFTLDSITDFSGKSYHDSILVRRFMTMGEQTMGSLSGEIADAGPEEPGKVILLLKDIFSKNVKEKFLPSDTVSSFTFEHVREGKYFLWAFRDRDDNGEYSFGDVVPFRPAERFMVYPDTLKIRARWPLEGVQLRLNKY